MALSVAVPILASFAFAVVIQAWLVPGAALASAACGTTIPKTCFSADANPAQPQEAVAFSDTSPPLIGLEPCDATVGIDSWDFGDGGSQATGATASHAYSSTGTYTVTLRRTWIHIDPRTGNICEAQSTAVQSITIMNPPALSAETSPTITGRLVEGQTLRESHAIWTGTPTSYEYQWEDCDVSGAGCSAIPGAISPTYTLSTSDVNHRIVVQETATNQLGAGPPATSGPSAVVEPLPPSNPGGSGAAVSSAAIEPVTAPSSSGGESGNGGLSGTTQLGTACPNDSAQGHNCLKVISVPTGCVQADGMLKVALPSDLNIASVRYRIDHRSRWIAGHGRGFAVSLSTSGLTTGTHHLTARITFPVRPTSQAFQDP